MFSREEMFHLETAFTMDSPQTNSPLPVDEIEAQASDSDSDISISSNTSTTVAPLEGASFMSMEVGLYEHFLFSPDTPSGASTSSSKTTSRSSVARKSSWFSWGSRASK